MAWTTGFPIKFTSDGDYTSQAIAKHIREIEKIYGHVNALRKFCVSTAPPLDAGDYDMWLDPSTMELKTYFADQGWVCVLRVANAKTSAYATTSGTSGDSGRFGGYLPSYYATVAALSALREQIGEGSIGGGTSNAQMPVFKGTWRDGGVYDLYDVVEYMGSSYVLLEGDGLVPPPDEDHWQLVAAAGRDFFMSMLDGGRADTEYAVFVSGGGA